MKLFWSSFLEKLALWILVCAHFFVQITLGKFLGTIFFDLFLYIINWFYTLKWTYFNTSWAGNGKWKMFHLFMLMWLVPWCYCTNLSSLTDVLVWWRTEGGPVGDICRIRRSCNIASDRIIIMINNNTTSDNRINDLPVTKVLEAIACLEVTSSLTHSVRFFSSSSKM